MKNLLTLSFCLALFLAASVTKADIITYDYSIAADNTLTTSNSWAIVDTFDSGRPGWTYSDGGTITNGSVSGSHAAPYNPFNSTSDNTSYYAVSNNAMDVSFGGEEYNYLGLFWGSADSYNSIEFYNDEEMVASYFGDDVLDPANGDQFSSATNQYINFYLTENFNKVKFVCDGIAFEFDNLAVGTHTPVPGAVLLGMIGLGFAGRKLCRYA